MADTQPLEDVCRQLGLTSAGIVSNGDFFAYPSNADSDRSFFARLSPEDRAKVRDLFHARLDGGISLMEVAGEVGVLSDVEINDLGCGLQTLLPVNASSGELTAFTELSHIPTLDCWHSLDYAYQFGANEADRSGLVERLSNGEFCPVFPKDGAYALNGMPLKGDYKVVHVSHRKMNGWPGVHRMEAVKKYKGGLSVKYDLCVDCNRNVHSFLIEYKNGADMVRIFIHHGENPEKQAVVIRDLGWKFLRRGGGIAYAFFDDDGSVHPFRRANTDYNVERNAYDTGVTRIPPDYESRRYALDPSPAVSAIPHMQFRSLRLDYAATIKAIAQASLGDDARLFRKHELLRFVSG